MGRSESSIGGLGDVDAVCRPKVAEIMQRILGRAMRSWAAGMMSPFF